MAKATEKQKEMIHLLVSQIKTWESSNDINSPTVVSDMFDEIHKKYYDGELTTEQCVEISQLLSKLLSIVKGIK